MGIETHNALLPSPVMLHTLEKLMLRLMCDLVWVGYKPESISAEDRIVAHSERISNIEDPDLLFSSHFSEN